MKIVALTKAEQGKAAADPWTVVHFGFGLAAGLTGIGFWPAMIGATAWEVFEQKFQRTGGGKKFFKASGPETLPNVAVDLAIFAVGHELGRRWNR